MIPHIDLPASSTGSGTSEDSFPRTCLLVFSHPMEPNSSGVLGTFPYSREYQNIVNRLVVGFQQLLQQDLQSADPEWKGTFGTIDAFELLRVSHYSGHILWDAFSVRPGNRGRKNREKPLILKQEFIKAELVVKQADTVRLHLHQGHTPPLGCSKASI